MHTVAVTGDQPFGQISQEFVGAICVEDYVCRLCLRIEVCRAVIGEIVGVRKFRDIFNGEVRSRYEIESECAIRMFLTQFAPRFADREELAVATSAQS